jgi:hypothetical protein
MRHMRHILLLATVAIMTMGTAVAQDNPQRERQEMTSEERDAAREARRAEWENMSDEDRAAVREKRKQKMVKRRAEMRERFENMSPEEQQAARERMRDRRDRHPGHKGPGQRDGSGKHQRPDAG